MSQLNFFRRPAINLASRLFIVIMVTIFVVEFAIMTALLILPIPGPIRALVDSVFLVAILFPILYFLFFKPLSRMAAERQIADTLSDALMVPPKSIEGIDFGHLYRSASAETATVGGDFYAIFEIAPDKFGVLIGDVSGKGLGAATLTSLVKNTLKAYAYENLTPAEIMARTNLVVSREVEDEFLVTLVFGVLDGLTGSFNYCCAGHTPSFIRRKTHEISWLKSHSPAIGVFPDLDFETGEETLGAGDVLVLYTDGVTESRRERELFDEQRLVNIVSQAQDTTAKDLPEVILEEVMDFSGGIFRDDLAILTVSLNPKVEGT